jgi:outer membrane protein TolC
MHWRSALPSLLAASLALAHAAQAETLDDAWRAALGTDQHLAAAQARVAAAEADLAAARAGRYPTLSTGTTAMRWRDTPAFDFSGAGLPITLPLFSGRTVTMADAQVALPVYSGGALGAGVAAATAARTAQEQSQQATRAAVKLGVATAYVGVLRAASALRAAAATTESLRAHVRDVDDRRRNGEVANNDYLAAAVSLAAAEQRSLEAANALEVANALFNRRLGRPLETAVNVEPLTTAPLGTITAEPLPALVSMALGGRPELAGLAASADAWTARADAAAAARRPQLSVSGGYNYLENDVLRDRDYWSVALGVRWTPFDGGKARHAADALTLQATAASAERNDLASAIELDVRRAWHAREAARARLAVAMAAVEQAQENLRVVRDRYRNGEGTNTEVLDAESLRTQSIGNRDDAVHDATLADIELAHAIGGL